MSIIIQNMGGDAHGVCIYHLRINRDLIAVFEHDRNDGLEACLRSAADAARLARLDKQNQYERFLRGER